MVLEMGDLAAVSEGKVQDRWFSEGDRVNWQREPRGGYGYGQVIAGVVIRVGKKRVQIRVLRKSGQIWVLDARWVEPRHLSPRASLVADLDERN